MAGASKQVDMRGKTCLVTGVGSPVGREVAKRLAGMGAVVVLGSHDFGQVEVARSAIIGAHPSAMVDPHTLDLSKRLSISDFVGAFKERHERLDVIVNVIHRSSRTKIEADLGTELTWMANVLGPYMLIERLLEVLRASTPTRVIQVVSPYAGGLDLSDTDFDTRTYSGLKAYRREVCESVRVYGEMHRYIPAQAHLQGFRVTELPVRHHRRKHGVTKYGANRFLNGFLDLLTLLFLSRRGSSPLHLFGRMGALFATVGGAILLYFLGWWLTGHGLRIRPLMLLAVTLIILAVQFVSLGLVAELVVAGQRPEADFRVRRTL